MSPVSGTSTPARKPGIRKVSLACNFCRARKRKCDGIRPVCGYCRLLKNNTCAFDVHSDGRRPVSRSYVSELEARIKTLEDVIVATAGVAELKAAEISADSRKEHPTTSFSSKTSLETDSPETLPEDIGASDEAMLDVGRLRLCLLKLEKGNTMNEGDTSNFCYYGPTASHQLARTDEPEPPLPHIHAEYELERSLNIRTSINIFDDGHEHSLLDNFWAWQDIHRTVVNRVLFLKLYRDGERDSEWVSPMLIDMMLAIGQQFGHQEHKGRRARYSARAEAMVVRELGRPRMATMQAIQLMGIFHMGAGRVSVAWSLNGLAVALSNRLGLHIDSTSLVMRGIMTNSMKKMRDTLFWGVFTLDRLFSIVMGLHPLYSRRFLSTRRPLSGIRASILPRNITLAGGDPDETSPHDILDPLESAAIWTRDLCDVVDTMLVEIYASDSPDRTPTDEYNMLIKNARVIQTFTDNLPTCTHVDFAIPANNLRAISLHTFLNLFAIMLNRPFLGRHRSQTAHLADQATERRYRSLAFSHCRTAALRIISLVGHFIQSPCFTTAHEIFSACTILLLSPGDPEAMKAVRVGLEYLDSLEKSFYWVEAAEDARRRIWALAKRWNVTPLFGSSAGAETTLSSAPVSETSANHDIGVPNQTGFTTGWHYPSASLGWTPLDGSEMNIPYPNDMYTGLDTTGLSNFPSADIASVYDSLGTAPDLTQQTGLWWFMGSQHPLGD